MIFRKRLNRSAMLWAVLLFVFWTPLMAQDGNLLINGDMESMEPAFWNKVNDGLDGAQAM